MNLILFDSSETTVPLPRADPRAVHLLDVLRRGVGDEFDAGIPNGPRGKGRVRAIGPDALELAFAWTHDCPPPPPITLLVGLPRPQTARDVLRDATTLGVGALQFVLTERGERNYAQSRLWTEGEWRRWVRTGAEQAFCTRLPEVTHSRPLAEAIGSLAGAGTRLALDNYEGAEALAQTCLTPPVTLCIGSERGWTATERELLRTAGFRLVHLGTRVLRTETACLSALTLARAHLGLM